MYYVYIIQSVSFPKQRYKGFSLNVERRLLDHNSKKVPSTKKNAPWTIVFYAAFQEKKLALNFETYLKKGSGIAFMKKRLLGEFN